MSLLEPIFALTDPMERSGAMSFLLGYLEQSLTIDGEITETRFRSGVQAAVVSVEQSRAVSS